MASANLHLRGTTVLHADRLADEGTLIIPSRLTAADVPRLAKLAGSRALTLLKEPDAAYEPETAAAISALHLKSIPRQSPEAGDAVQAAVRQRNAVLYLPPTVTAPKVANLEIPRAILEDLVRLGAPVQPVGMDHPASAALTVDAPGSLEEAVYAISAVIPAAKLTFQAVQAAIIEASAEAFTHRPTLNAPLGRLLLAGFKKHGTTGSITDGLDGSVTSYSKIFAASAALAGLIKAEAKQPRVGIALPPGRAALIANIATVLAGKVPVNINFTAAKESIESAIKQSGVEKFLTADTFVRKLQSFPWPATKHLIFLERVLPQLKPKMMRWLIALKLLPVSVLAGLLKLPQKGGDEEAALLFTSGSSGEPKGVGLSHRNIISNVTQFALRLNLPPNDRIVGSLPLFHSMGGTVTVWFPILEGVSLVTYPNPMEVTKLAELIDQHRAVLLLTTPTFLRGFLKRVKVEQLASLKLIVTGAEKLPVNLEEEFRKKFGKPVMEGYGLTETSPATNFNLPDAEGGAWPVMPTRRLGSVGQLLAGVAVKITDPITGNELPVDQTGMLWFKGPNVFKGYLKQPRKTEEVLQDDWFRTGDIARLDADGFLHIEGRLNRFSKIGGEMVPHEVVEDHIIKAMRLDGDSERRIAVVGVPDDDKGEALVLISTVASEAIKQEIIQLRYTLLERGVPALWIPKQLVRVEQIPILASGKLDLKACEKLAAQRGMG
ncbi:MAG: AMP-binding protein [Verrucomicrobiota bacterium]